MGIIGDKVQGKYSRVIVLGDPHGSKDRLDEIKKVCSKRCKGEKFIYIGDYMDRGGQGVAIAEEVFSDGGLIDQKKAIGLIGNHDVFFISAIEGDYDSYVIWVLNGGEAVFKELKIEGGFKFLKKNLRLKKLVKNMRKKGKVYHLENNTLFTHSGLPLDEKKRLISYKDLKGLEAIKELQKDFIKGKFNYKDLFGNGTIGLSIIWSGDAVCRTWEWYDLLKEDDNLLDKLLKLFGVERIVQGHFPDYFNHEVRCLHNNKIINIDAGMTDEYGGGGGALIFNGDIIEKYEHKIKKFTRVE